MSPKALERLEAIFARAQHDAGRWPAEETIKHFVEFFGAHHDTSGSTNVLRCGGVTGTCTNSSKESLLASWCGCAARRIEREKQARKGGV